MNRRWGRTTTGSAKWWSVRGDIFQGSVEKYISDAAKKLGGSVKFVDAVRFQTGEGIEKKQEDFAAEVAAQMNMGK